MPHPQAPVLVDPGNPLLGKSSCRLETGAIEAPGETLGVITVRTPTTTLTVFLSPADVRNWAGLLDGLARQLSGSGLVQASPQDLGLLTALSRKGGQA